MCKEVYWMHLAKDRGKCKAPMDGVMTFQVSEKEGKLFTDWVTFRSMAPLKGVGRLRCDKRREETRNSNSE
jgi:hypothetical protein